MAKVNANKPKPFAEKLAEKITLPKEDDPWTTKAVEEAPPAAMSIEEVAKTIGATILKNDPMCDHGINRVWKTGVSKHGKPWGMWACNDFHAKDKCDPQWYNLSADGTWAARL